jgi:hypothetical protein
MSAFSPVIVAAICWLSCRSEATRLDWSGTTTAEADVAESWLKPTYAPAPKATRALRAAVVMILTVIKDAMVVAKKPTPASSSD